MNRLALLGNSLHPLSSLLDDRSWSIDIQGNFAIGVTSSYIEDITNWDTTWMSWIIFFSSCVKYLFISSSIKVKLVAILLLFFDVLQVQIAFLPATYTVVCLDLL